MEFKSTPALTYPNKAWEVPYIDKETNCYAYARNDINAFNETTQPGGLSGHLINSAPAYTCDKVIGGAKSDGLILPIVQDGCDSICPTGYHLTYAAVAEPTEIYPNGDFHWIRQNNNTFEGGRWSQKHGFKREPTNVDASDQVITCPSTANNHYAFSIAGSNKISWLNYTEPCGYLCAPDIPQAPSHTSGLSTGAKAGIGAGASVAGLLIIGAALHKLLPHNPLSKAVRSLRNTMSPDPEQGHHPAPIMLTSRA